VFRRFNELSARNLLILQGRVEALEAEQQLQDKEDFDLVARTDTPSYAVMSRALSYEDFSASAFVDGRGTNIDSVPSDIVERWSRRRGQEASRLGAEYHDLDITPRDGQDRARWELAQSIRIAIKEYRTLTLLVKATLLTHT
jgi:hypothetical protein